MLIGLSWPLQSEIHPDRFFYKSPGWAGPLLALARSIVYVVSVAELQLRVRLTTSDIGRGKPGYCIAIYTLLTTPDRRVALALLHTA